jgi:hypothetical protein
MNAMGHGVPTMIGVDHRVVAQTISRLLPDYMVMGERGMHDMSEMEMPVPDNTAPMMTGTGPFGAIGMGGMFTTLKVRKDQPPGSNRDPGWYRQPPGTAARSWTQGDAPPPEAALAPSATASAPPTGKDAGWQAHKPASGHTGH